MSLKIGSHWPLAAQTPSSAPLCPRRWCQLTTPPSRAFLRNSHHLNTKKHELLFCLVSWHAAWLQAWSGTRAVPPAGHKLHVYLSTLYLLFIANQRVADFLSLPLRVRIVICEESGSRLLGARIPGLFFWCLLNVSVSCGGEAGDESSCVNNLWHFPH